jgi:hypothetical protein
MFREFGGRKEGVSAIVTATFIDGTTQIILNTWV